MKYIKAILVTVLFCFPFVCEAHLPLTQTVQQNTLAPMLKKVTPAVVNISVEQVTLHALDELIPQAKNNTTQIPVKTFAVGSGVIFNSKKGLIVTNAHVVKDQKIIVVTLKNGERFHAKLVAKSTSYDIAILHIDATDLTQLPFANSDNVKVGDFVTAIGSPYGLAQTVTSGVVSALNRAHPQIEGYQNFIQTDAPINPGNSGGALLNMQGELIGINTAIVAPDAGNIGIGFAIPSNLTQSVIDQLLKYGKVKRGVLGVIVQDLTPELANVLHIKDTKGALVSEIEPNTPAADAGIQVGDVITEVDHHPIRSSTQLRNTMGLIHPNTKAVLTVIRDNKTKTITITAADPKKIKEKVLPYLSGMRLQDFHELALNGHRLRGVAVTGLSDSSDGALAGLMSGDVITAVNLKPVTTITELEKALAGSTKPVLLSVNRDGDNSFFVLNAD